ncbi:hypothetical protein PBI_JOHANN_7 [Microbacterium phage Johann]|uniref:Uncharacterized protein n=2 Tax=Goodmanvirus goodman TaxID=2734238 RepID=A0A3G3LZX4_9CAUD|nr:hypothetical protein HOU56_gp07 [Microbacterium phage Goodman]AYQ99463.1 hypothetical protein PBI_GOODMAN_7 [Microbacterium phage Goodman]AYQ99631.1 hypothetical protein PBI_JOHANN_7 [Microbacterium phage Johann]
MTERTRTRVQSEDDTTEPHERNERGRLIIEQWNRYTMDLQGSVANLRETVALLAPNTLVRSMVLYTIDIREPHERNSWTVVESWSWTKLKEIRNPKSRSVSKTAE